MSHKKRSNRWAVGPRKEDNKPPFEGFVENNPPQVNEWTEKCPSNSVSKNEITEPPQQFSLSQNYPNPFNPTTNISFTLPCKSYVSLKVFDIIGREIVTLIDKELPAGNYTRQWNAVNIASGIYFYKLKAGLSVDTKKLILLR